MLDQAWQLSVIEVSEPAAHREGTGFSSSAPGSRSSNGKLWAISQQGTGNNPLTVLCQAGPMKLQQPLHLHLRDLRTRAGLSQLQLAILSTVDARRVCDYEQGLRKPSPAHLELVAPHLKTNLPALLLHPDLWRSRSSRDKWFQDKHHFWPDIERFGHERLKSAMAAFGPGIKRLVDACSESGRAFLTLTPSDSSPEWTFQLKHILGGTEPSLASPLGIQFRRHFVTHPKEHRYVGDCSVPCLIGACTNVRYILIPKVSVRTFAHPDFPITMDFLCGIREPVSPFTT